MCTHTIDLIERDNDHDMADAIFHLLSRNEKKSTYKATEEEELLEMVNELRRAYMKDVSRSKEADEEEADYMNNFSNFMAAAEEKAEAYKQTNAGFRRLACMPTFTLSLVMASQVRRHYTHATWFKLGVFKEMVEVHGAVSASGGTSVLCVR